MATTDELVTMARDAAHRAHAPYSQFRVGCAVESVDGRIATGANMENACYRLGLCAEQSALTTAQHVFGLAQVARVAVAGGPWRDGAITGIDAITPCGGCRQAIFEAAALSGRDIEIICAGASGDAYEITTISALLPAAFGPAAHG
ncbi:cytidine deaminase [Croceicoccus ponticola]|uniref:Cytidine deaminase n=1 Tax=Croceicoccus ponticola TaxID=2217664 RepID=A0A437GVG6_9SPHN|nr:cytidine deaminase [Croceicoccus ponticola]RVQ65780.1 cytidine deaminase [Croceicoccus ponticola]